MQSFHDNVGRRSSLSQQMQSAAGSFMTRGVMLNSCRCCVNSSHIAVCTARSRTRNVINDRCQPPSTAFLPPVTLSWHGRHILSTVASTQPLPPFLLCCNTYAAFYWARELVFTGNKLIMFTTSLELSHYVVFSWIIAERKVGVVLKSIFSLFICIFLYFYESCLYVFCVWKMRQIPFDLIA